jgi:AcrR family transcriptional regulator
LWDRILQAARRLLAEQGYDATTMKSIASSAGISQARLYRLCGSRQEVIEAVLVTDAHLLAGEVVLEVAKAPDVQSKVRALVSAFFAFVDRRRQSNRLLYSHGQLDQSGLGDVMRFVRTALADFFSQQLAQSLSLAEDNDQMRLMAFSVTAMAEGAAAAWLAGPRLDVDRAVDAVTRIALNALDIPPALAGIA